MADWLSKALEMFPELCSDFELAEISPMGFWIELRIALEDAYSDQPINEDLVSRIYDYASWCVNQLQTESAETDLPTAVAVCLIEHLPETPAVAGDLYRWMSVDTFMSCESLFRYHLTDPEYTAFRDNFLSKKKAYTGPSRL